MIWYTGSSTDDTQRAKDNYPYLPDGHGGQSGEVALQSGPYKWVNILALPKRLTGMAHNDDEENFFLAMLEVRPLRRLRTGGGRPAEGCAPAMSATHARVAA